MKRPSRRASAEAAARDADRALLARRLERLGLRRRVHVHENRTVLVSVTRRGQLRIHRGFAYASDRVLKSVIAFLDPGTRVAERRRAERQLVNFPVEEFVRSPGRKLGGERLRPGDRKIVAELAKLHERFNQRHFGARLGSIAFRVSSRMRTRLGELTVNPRTKQATEIAISRYHLECDGWDEVQQTLLHEMVHQWQVESGLDPDHGDTFRRKALEVGVVPGARRVVKPQRRAARQR